MTTIKLFFLLFIALSVIFISLSLENTLALSWKKVWELLEKNNSHDEEKNMAKIKILVQENSELENKKEKLTSEYLIKIARILQQVKHKETINTCLQEEPHLIEKAADTSLEKSNGVGYKQTLQQLFAENIPNLIKFNDDIFKFALRDFALFQEQLEVRCALPYRVLLNLFAMYSKSELITFKKSFTLFYHYWGTEEGRRILRNKFLTPEQKLGYIDEKLAFQQNDFNFYEFLCYILTKYEYRTYQKIYQNFLKVYDVKFTTGIVKVVVSDEEGKNLFLKHWPYSMQQFQLNLEINKALVGGVKIYTQNNEIDYSFQQILIKQNEKEVYA